MIDKFQAECIVKAKIVEFFVLAKRARLNNKSQSMLLGITYDKLFRLRNGTAMLDAVSFEMLKSLCDALEEHLENGAFPVSSLDESAQEKARVRLIGA